MAIYKKLNRKIQNYIEYSHEGGYDNRLTNLNQLHNISDKSVNILLKEIPLFQNMKIADIGCGDGNLISNLEHYLKGKLYKITALDISVVQLDLVSKRFSNNKNIYIVHDDIRHLHIKRKFNIIITKSVLHELPFSFQISAINKLLKRLRPKGKLIVWEFFLEESTKTVVNKVIRMKDHLSGYPMLVKERCFLTYSEFTNILCKTKHVNYKIVHEYDYIFSSYRQLEGDFKNDYSKLNQFNSYIRTICAELSLNQKIALNYKDDLKDNICFNMHCKILTIWK